MLTLYTTPLSANGRKVLAVSPHLGLEPELRLIDVYRGEGRSPEYLAIDPTGKVPFLVEGDFALDRLTIADFSIGSAGPSPVDSGSRAPPAGRSRPVRTLTRDQARRVYDRIGRLQDTQAFYEDRALDALVEHGDFGAAHRVFELGCGTGRLAHRLLSEHLPADATYVAIDLSPAMAAIATERLAALAPRAVVRESDGAPRVDEPAGSFDRFVSTYVLDLLSDDDIAAVLAEAHRLLGPGGLLCVCGLSTGAGPASRVVARAWAGLHRLSPALVGGCRPLDLEARLPTGAWRVRHAERMSSFGVPSEVVVAERA